MKKSFDLQICGGTAWFIYRRPPYFSVFFKEQCQYRAQRPGLTARSAYRMDELPLKDV